MDDWPSNPNFGMFLPAPDVDYAAFGSEVDLPEYGALNPAPEQQSGLLHQDNSYMDYLKNFLGEAPNISSGFPREEAFSNMFGAESAGPFRQLLVNADKVLKAPDNIAMQVGQKTVGQVVGKTAGKWAGYLTQMMSGGNMFGPLG
jgi:hypothetical protein